MKAAQTHKVKRVCITSSVAAIATVDPKDAPESFDESNWSDTSYKHMGAYEKSKTLAERAAWDFVKGSAQTPGAHQIELSVVNPVFVIGPTLVKTDFASALVINMFMNNLLPGGIPVLKIGVVDVREVAQAHLNCIESDAAQGHRHILCNESLWWSDMCAILKKNYGKYGYPVADKQAWYCLLWMISFCRADA